MDDFIHRDRRMDYRGEDPYSSSSNYQSGSKRNFNAGFHQSSYKRKKETMQASFLSDKRNQFNLTSLKGEPENIGDYTTQRSDSTRELGFTDCTAAELASGGRDFDNTGMKGNRHGNRQQIQSGAETVEQKYGGKAKDKKRNWIFGKSHNSENDQRYFGNNYNSENDQRYFGNNYNSDNDQRYFGNNYNSDNDQRYFGNSYNSENDPRHFEKNYNSEKDQRYFGNNYNSENDQMYERTYGLPEFHSDSDGRQYSDERTYHNKTSGNQISNEKEQIKQKLINHATKSLESIRKPTDKNIIDLCDSDSRTSRQENENHDFSVEEILPSTVKSKDKIVDIQSAPDDVIEVSDDDSTKGSSSNVLTGNTRQNSKTSSQPDRSNLPTGIVAPLPSSPIHKSFSRHTNAPAHSSFVSSSTNDIFKSALDKVNALKPYNTLPMVNRFNQNINLSLNPPHNILPQIVRPIIPVPNSALNIGSQLRAPILIAPTQPILRHPLFKNVTLPTQNSSPLLNQHLLVQDILKRKEQEKFYAK